MDEDVPKTDQERDSFLTIQFPGKRARPFAS